LLHAAATAGSGIDVTGQAISVKVDGTTITIDGSGNLTSSAGTPTVLAGAGLVANGGALDVNPGNGIEIVSDKVSAKSDVTGGTNIADVVNVSANGIAVRYEATTLEIASTPAGNALKVAAGGIGVTQLNSAVAGAGLTGGSGTALAVGAGTGITVNADSIAVNVSAFAGEGLENDGTGKIRIAAAAAGDGLTGGAGSALAVGAGDGISVTANAVAVDASALAGVALAANSNNLDVQVDGTTIEVNGSNQLQIKSVGDFLKIAKIITREPANGTINHVNKIFTLAATPVLGTEQVFLNGILQDQGAGEDYTISGATITFADAPRNNDKIRVTYISQ
jgi:hypothetical protein